jgi:hypothetical protein
LLAGLARAPRTGLSGPRARVAELAEDLAQLVVDGLQRCRVLIQWQLPEPVKARDGLVHASVTGGVRRPRWRPVGHSRFHRAGLAGWHSVGSFRIHALDFALALPLARPRTGPYRAWLLLVSA